MNPTIEEKAPDLLEQGEGKNQKPSEDSVWSKATRHARARAARRGTVAADHRIAIKDTPDRTATVHRRPTAPAPDPTPRAQRFAADVARLPLVIRRTSIGNRTHVWRTADGLWWRKGGLIQIRPGALGERAFVLTLFKGANASDVKFLLRIIADARAGIGLDLWMRVTAPWADDQTFLFDSSRLYEDPHTHIDTSSRALVCDEPRCVHQWHDYPLHELDSAEGDGYSITVSRYGKAKDWHVDVDVNGCEFSPTELARFINDLQWMRTECERVNSEVTR